MSSGGSSMRLQQSGRAVDPPANPAEPTLDASSPPSTPSPAPGVDAQATVISSRPLALGLLQQKAFQLSEAGRLLEGERLGQFILHEFIGGGGMGAVFRALDTTLNRDVAVKVLSRSQSADEETLRRFQNEAQSAARLDHENIARVYYVGEDQGIHYIVFEYIEGINLRDLVDQSGPLSLAEAISYVLQIAEALAHSSQRDVIHRDIKPSNVLVTPDGKAKLVDMGLARLHQVGPGADDLTASGVTLGTFDYISPEQARDPRAADVRSDLYSLGCSFYYMLTGRPPFMDGTVLQKLLQHQSEAPPDPRALRPDLPGEITPVVFRLMAKEPSDRFQRPEELVAELVRLSQRIGIPHGAVVASAYQSVPIRGRGVWRRHLPWAVPVALLLAVVMALDSYWSQSAAEGTIEPNLLPAGISARSKPSNGDSRAGSRFPPSVGGGKEEGFRSIDENRQAADFPLPFVSGSPQLPRAPFDVGDEPGEEESAAKELEPNSGAAPFSTWGSAWGTFRSDWSRFQDATLDTFPLLGNVFRGTPSVAADVRKAAGASHEATDGVLVVSDQPAGPRSHATLEAAVRAARNGDIIELHYDGAREERPLSLSNVKLTIRSGEGYDPQIVFRPAQVDSARPDQGMITVTGGELTLSNIQVTFDVPRTPNESWALFELHRAERIALERCVLTIRNSSSNQASYSPHVSFFEIPSQEGIGMMLMPDPLAPHDPVIALELVNSVVRGEATLLKIAEVVSARLEWNNGLLATSERLLELGASSNASSISGLVEIDLRNVTAVVRKGLILSTNSAEAPYQSTLQVKCADSVLRGNSDPPLVEQRGVESTETRRARLHWDGQRTFYEAFDVFWKATNLVDSKASGQMNFPQWRDYWGESHETLPRRDAVVWKTPLALERVFHEQKPDDYALSDEGLGSAARTGASDGQEIGLRGQRLPRILAE